MNDTVTPDVPKTVAARLFQFLQAVLGRRVVAVAVGVFIVVSATLDALGKTTNAWAYIKQAFAEKTSVLNTAEIEVLDEWVVLIDAADSFLQADAYRHQLATASIKFSSREASKHLARNLRVVRDPKNAGYWLLTADITIGRSTREDVLATIDCLKRQVSSWESDDVLSPWFRNAQPIDFSLATFRETYGRPKNLPSDHKEPTRPDTAAPGKVCPPPYA